MDKQAEAEIEFRIKTGEHQSDRLVQSCMNAIATMIDGQKVNIGGKDHYITVIGKDGRIMFDIRDLPGFDHIEFTLEKTGWGR